MTKKLMIHNTTYSYEGRSANGEVIYLIRKAIEDFEKQHGKIELP